MGLHPSTFEAELLTPAQERELAELRDQGDIEARNRLVLSNLRFAAVIAARFRKRQGFLAKQFSLDEYVSAANVGLIRAADGFNPDKGRFTTYAQPWVYEGLRAWIFEVRYPICVPRNSAERERSDRYGRARVGRKPSPAVLEAIRRVTDAPIYSLGSAQDPLEHEIPDRASPCPEYLFDLQEKTATLGILIRAHLSAAERGVFQMRHGLANEEPMTWVAIGKRIDCSRQYAQYVGEKAMAKLIPELGEADRWE